MTLRRRKAIDPSPQGGGGGAHSATEGAPAAVRLPPPPCFAWSPAPAARERIWRALAMLFFLMIAATPAHAVHPDEILADPNLEARAREIGGELRCLVCRNQSIEDSDADLAHDLRVVVRDRLKAGDNNQQVIDYIHARYGDFVLLRPPFQTDTLLLWGGPALILVLGALGIAMFYRRRRNATAPPPLTPDEQHRLAAVLGEGAER